MPVYLCILKAPKRGSLTFFHNKMNNNLATQGNKHITIHVPHPAFVKFLTMDWGRTSTHTLQTGFFGNMFLLGGRHIKATVSIYAQATVLLNSYCTPILPDIDTILKLDMNPPIRGKYLGSFRWMGGVCEVLLAAANNFHMHLMVRNLNFAHFQDTHISTKLEEVRRTEVKVVLYLQAMSLWFSVYWNAQKTPESCVDFKSPTKLVKRVMDTDKTWVLNFSAATRTTINITTLMCIIGGTTLPASKPSAAGDNGTVSTMGVTGMSIRTINMSAFYTLVQEKVGSFGGDKKRGGGTTSEAST
jgi:hypothetical protein